MVNESSKNKVVLFFKKKFFANKLTFFAVVLFLLISVTFAVVCFVYRGEKNRSGVVTPLASTEEVAKSRSEDVPPNENENVMIENSSKEGVDLNSKTKEVGAFKPAGVSIKDYSKLYPDFYTQRPEKQVILEKTVYLTFDDGPSERTPEVLDILKKYNIKATFFVVGNSSQFGKECMKRIVAEGHTIAMHSYTHDFKKIYKNVESYLEDIYKLYKLIYDVTGVKPSIFRFAGGSKNGFNKGNYREIISEMVRRGFDYFDWNLCNNDAISKTITPVSKCVDSVLKNSKNYNTAVVLMHDSKPKTTTVEALPKIIDGLKEQGFSFEKLSNKIYPVDFSLIKPYS